MNGIRGKIQKSTTIALEKYLPIVTKKKYQNPFVVYFEKCLHILRVLSYCNFKPTPFPITDPRARLKLLFRLTWPNPVKPPAPRID